MPIFEYECKKCNEKFEFLMLKKDECVECPKCSSNDVQKVFSVFGFTGGDYTCASSGSSKCGGCSSHNCTTCK